MPLEVGHAAAPWTSSAFGVVSGLAFGVLRGPDTSLFGIFPSPMRLRVVERSVGLVDAFLLIDAGRLTCWLRPGRGASFRGISWDAVGLSETVTGAEVGSVTGESTFGSVLD